MTQSHRSSLIAAVSIVGLSLLTGCASSKPQPFKLSFLPSTPLPTEVSFEAPPVVEPRLYASTSPELMQRALPTPPRPPEVDGLIVRAEEHFQNGKRLYQAGDSTGARHEFDLATDILLSAPDNIPDRQRVERRLDRMADAIYRYDREGLGAGANQQDEVVYDKSPLDSILELTFPTDPQLSPRVKEELAATTSQLPLEANDTVLSYIHYFSTERGHKTLVAGLRRSGRFRPLVQRILDEEGVPQELIYLAQVESGFLPRARSNKSAVGMWQFVQFRGRQYGLNQSALTDDRMDPELATRAAARHLRDLYQMFGDWYLAMAAYNCGPGCVDRAVERTGFADFWELRNRNALPKETGNYVPVILAVTIMAKNPKDYDLENLDMDAPVEYDTVAVDTATSLALIADASDRPVPEIQELNPSLLKQVAPAGYHMHVPKGTSAAVLTALDIVPAARRSTWRMHRVTSVETLAQIAHRYSVSPAAITSANPRLDPPEAGDLLVIPVSYTAQPHSARKVTSSASRKAPRRTLARRAAPAVPARPVRTGTYKTASVTSKHRSTAD